MPGFSTPNSAIVNTWSLNLNQNAGTYDITTCTGGDVYIAGFAIYTPIAAGGLTSVSIQTDDTTQQIFLSAQDGAVANLTQQKLIKSGNMPMYLTPNKKIQFTIAGNGNAGTILFSLRFSPIKGGFLS